MTITIIAAIGKNRELGKDNDLLWHLPNDLKRFKKVTKGHTVIMGRKTFESLGKALPHRTNIIITRNKNYTAENCTVVNSLTDALQKVNNDNPFILGGAEIYAQSMDIADTLDLTLVDAVFDADAFFPEIDTTLWKEIYREDHQTDEQHPYNYSFVTYKKRK
jgi:dihydrofolate reductase